VPDEDEENTQEVTRHRARERNGFFISDRDRSGIVMDIKKPDGLIISDEEAIAISSALARREPSQEPKLQATRDKWQDYWREWVKTGMTRHEWAGKMCLDYHLVTRMFNWVEDDMVKSDRGSTVLMYFKQTVANDLRRLMDKQGQYEGKEDTKEWLAIQEHIRKNRMLLAKAEGLLESKQFTAQAPSVHVIFPSFKQQRDDGPRVLNNDIEATVVEG
jgi:leucyl aminopeptidase (aminopeptidase T)